MAIQTYLSITNWSMQRRCRVAAYLLLTLLFIFTYLALSPRLEAKTVLVIESYHSEHPWDQNYKQGLEAVLGEAHEFIYFEMDTKRIPATEFLAKADLAWQRYLETAPELVVLGDDNALKYLGTRFTQTDTPVVYLGINANPRDYGVVGAGNIFGVLERPLLKRSVVMLKALFPFKKVLLLLDASPTSVAIVESLLDSKNRIAFSGVELNVRLIEKYSQWQDTVLNAQQEGYDLLLPGLYHTLLDDAGLHVPDAEVIAWTSANTPIPPFGFWGFSVGAGKNIGGYVVSGYEEGKLAGEIAHKLLAGEKLLPLPQTGLQGHYLFSKSQLARWNIQLPSEIHQQAQFVE